MGGQKGEDVGCAVKKERAARTREFSPMPLCVQVGKPWPREGRIYSRPVTVPGFEYGSSDSYASFPGADAAWDK